MSPDPRLLAAAAVVLLTPHLPVPDAAVHAVLLVGAVLAVAGVVLRRGRSRLELLLDASATVVVGGILVGLVLGLLRVLSPAGWGAALAVGLGVMAFRRPRPWRDLDLPALEPRQVRFAAFAAVELAVIVGVSYAIALQGENTTAFHPLSLSLQQQDGDVLSVRVAAGDEPGRYRLDLVLAGPSTRTVVPVIALGEDAEQLVPVTAPAGEPVSLRLVRLEDGRTVRELDVDPAAGTSR